MSKTATIIFWISGIIALTMAALIYAVKEKKKMQLIKLLNDLFWTINYFCKGFGAFTGAAQNGVAVIRDVVFYYRACGKKWASGVLWCVFFCLFFGTIPIYTWIGYISLLPAVASVISTISLFIKNPQLTRYLSIPACSMTLIYAAVVGNIFGVISNSFMVISAAVGIVLELRRRKKAKKV